jgi:predicted nucleic acid-binding protein
MYYLDTNVLVYAVENHPLYGGRSQKILADVVKGRIAVYSSMQVLSEVISTLVKINRLQEREGGEKIDIPRKIELILALPINWIDVDFQVIKGAASYGYKISGSDYIHLASMELFSLNKIFSADREFDKVGFLARIDPLNYT